MREIKFRLINRFNKIVGYEKWYSGAWDKDKYWSAFPCWLYSTDQKSWRPEEIKHRTKDQYTGLRDKNDKEIFFRDLGKDRNGNIWRVDEIPRTAGWGVTCISDTGAHDECYPQLLCYGWIVMHDFEIIGNIYEHGHLLEGQQCTVQKQEKK